MGKCGGDFLIPPYISESAGKKTVSFGLILNNETPLFLHFEVHPSNGKESARKL